MITRPLQKAPFCPIPASGSNFNPQNTKCIPVVKIIAFLGLEQNWTFFKGLDYAEGKDSGIIDLVLVGNIDPYHLDDLSKKSDRYIKRKIRTLVLKKDEFSAFQTKLKDRPCLLIWEAKR